MVNLSENKKAKIKYPCKWGYRIIVDKETIIESVIFDVLDEVKYEISRSNTSRNGKYQSYNVSIEIISEQERLKLFDSFKRHLAVKMVL